MKKFWEKLQERFRRHKPDFVDYTKIGVDERQRKLIDFGLENPVKCKNINSSCSPKCEYNEAEKPRR